VKPAFIEKLIGRMERLDAQSVASIVARLAEEKGFLETVFDALEEGVVVLSSDDEALYLNRAARTLLGLSDKFGPGDSLHRYLPAPFWKVIDEDRKTLKPRAAVHHDVQITYPQPRFLQIYVSTLHGDSSPETDVLLIIRDVTETHRRAALHAESERISAVTTLAAGVAHEIGNPLNSLHIYLQLMEREVQLLSGAPREKLQKQIQVCSNEIARLDQVVSQFLKAVRPIRPVLTPLSIHEILNELLDVLGPEIENRDVLVEKDFARNLPKILADRDQMKQVFFNLIRNSLQAMKKDGILLLSTQSAGERALITVRDNGGGISTEALQHIFEPHFSTKEDGSGLGLMIVQRIIRDHGGLIEVSSEEGRGTSFRIFLPVAEKRVRLLESKGGKKEGKSSSGH
jgi:nitrogen-specific signal transduction histidine kinase